MTGRLSKFYKKSVSLQCVFWGTLSHDAILLPVFS